MSPGWALARPQSQHPESNRGPAPYDGAAQPAVLCCVFYHASTWPVPPLVPPVCRTGALLVSYASVDGVGPTRVELITSGVSGRRSSS
jgi:hypothetical protein